MKERASVSSYALRLHHPNKCALGGRVHVNFIMDITFYPLAG